MSDDDQSSNGKIIDIKTDALRYAREVIGCDPFASSLGMVVDEVRDSYARVSLTIQHRFCNTGGRTHGGVLFSLADQALAVAAHSTGLSSFALEIKINYLQGSRPGDKITAEATPVDVRNRVSLWNVNLTNQNGDKIAVAQGMAYHLVK
ncbi:MAG: PaaI family thioesterase [Desulfomonile tiedjei]|uniref:PaaI family thioesterase n=1 Tax=Desulfomonile tiedjei TaxID=2358 RepID=A0A9D6Z6A7_9BACT|nr:PaaI family thioesterase [Desulfomonile tiedjei]